MQFPNVYTHRKVADTASKGCDVCFKPTTSVLLSQGPDGKDFFYVCPSHLKDRNFCSPIIDQAAIDAKKKKEMDEEMQKVKMEYEEKQKKKKDKAKDKDKDTDKNEKSKGKDGKAEEKKPEEVPGKDKAEDSPAPEEDSRVFSLHRNFYSQRIEKKRQLDVNKRNRERMQQPNFWPSVPKDKPI